MFRESLPNLSSKVRFIHAVPGTSNIDIYTGGNLLKSNLAFGTISEYIDFAPGDYVIDIYPAGTYDTAIFSGTLTIIPNSYSTASLYVVGVLNGEPEVGYILTRDGRQA